MTDADRERQYAALWAEHDRLRAAVDRLHGQRPLDVAAHEALMEELARHRERLAAWLERYRRTR
jgi:hypothetical protein